MVLGVAGLLLGSWALMARPDDDDEVGRLMEIDVAVSIALAVASATVLDPPPTASRVWWWFVRVVRPLCILAVVSVALIAYHRVIWAIRTAPAHLPPSPLMLLGAQAPLPVVEDVEWPAFRDHTRQQLKGLEPALPAETVQKLKELLDQETATPDAVQKLLDPYCLVGISINPESRVKAVRGPADAELIAKREAVVLIKVQNEAGVSPALNVSGPQITAGDKAEDDRWLRAVGGGKLGGQRVEYLVLKLTAFETGKREATLKFDAGQGTQDLGFRAEVPILFRVK